MIVTVILIFLIIVLLLLVCSLYWWIRKKEETFECNQMVLNTHSIASTLQSLLDPQKVSLLAFFNDRIQTLSRSIYLTDYLVLTFRSVLLQDIELTETNDDYVCQTSSNTYRIFCGGSLKGQGSLLFEILDHNSKAIIASVILHLPTQLEIIMDWEMNCQSLEIEVKTVQCTGIARAWTFETNVTYSFSNRLYQILYFLLNNQPWNMLSILNRVIQSVLVLPVSIKINDLSCQSLKGLTSVRNHLFSKRPSRPFQTDLSSSFPLSSSVEKYDKTVVTLFWQNIIEIVRFLSLEYYTFHSLGNLGDSQNHCQPDQISKNGFNCHQTSIDPLFIDCLKEVTFQYKDIITFNGCSLRGLSKLEIEKVDVLFMDTKQVTLHINIKKDVHLVLDSFVELNSSIWDTLFLADPDCFAKSNNDRLQLYINKCPLFIQFNLYYQSSSSSFQPTSISNIIIGYYDQDYSISAENSCMGSLFNFAASVYDDFIGNTNQTIYSLLLKAIQKNIPDLINQYINPLLAKFPILPLSILPITLDQTSLLEYTNQYRTIQRIFSSYSQRTFFLDPFYDTSYAIGQFYLDANIQPTHAQKAPSNISWKDGFIYNDTDTNVRHIQSISITSDVYQLWIEMISSGWIRYQSILFHPSTYYQIRWQEDRFIAMEDPLLGAWANCMIKDPNNLPFVAVIVDPYDETRLLWWCDYMGLYTAGYESENLELFRIIDHTLLMPTYPKVWENNHGGVGTASQIIGVMYYPSMTSDDSCLRSAWMSYKGYGTQPFYLYIDENAFAFCGILPKTDTSSILDKMIVMDVSENKVFVLPYSLSNPPTTIPNFNTFLDQNKYPSDPTVLDAGISIIRMPLDLFKGWSSENSEWGVITQETDHVITMMNKVRPIPLGSITCRVSLSETLGNHDATFVSLSEDRLLFEVKALQWKRFYQIDYQLSISIVSNANNGVLNPGIFTIELVRTQTKVSDETTLDPLWGEKGRMVLFFSSEGMEGTLCQFFGC